MIKSIQTSDAIPYFQKLAHSDQRVMALFLGFDVKNKKNTKSNHVKYGARLSMDEYRLLNGRCIFWDPILS